MAVTPGQTLSHYRLVEKIGEGGMGVVWKARDTHLDRDVALKVLPTGTLANDASRKRFRNEALALSKLNHPNIETVHDFDTQDGIAFLVMEYIPGETVDEKLRAGPLSESEALQLGVQLADGLAAAHGRAVLHRDLKPTNLLVTPEGRMKILDFGLAKLLRPGGEPSQVETMTQTQTTVGTPPYMAPEQLRGEQADRRSDIFALGDVLYEMVTGRRAFRGGTAAVLSDAILHKAPLPPCAVNHSISPELERVVLKCLEKNPANRYQSAQEVGIDLRRLASAISGSAGAGRRSGMPRFTRLAAGFAVLALLALLVWWWIGHLKEQWPAHTVIGRIESIAVLPLKNLMGDPEQQYFVEGMHEALIADLARIGTLRVISRTSAMRYQNAGKALPVIAEELGVDAVVEGSVLRAGDQVRITAQLIHAPSDSHLWADYYEGDLSDIMRLQSDTARAIAREIKAVLTPEEEARMLHERRVDPEAYEAYLKGRYHLNKRNREGVTTALSYFQEAVGLDPTDALAHAGLADTYTVLGWYNWERPSEAFPKAKIAAMQALALDETLAEAHTSLAAVLMNYEWDWAAAEGRFKRAIELNPGYPTAHHWYALLLVWTGRSDEAIAEIAHSRSLDPLSLVINTVVGYVDYHARRFEKAARQIDRVLEMEPDFLFAHTIGLMIDLQRGRFEEAGVAAQRAMELTDGGLDEQAHVIEVHALAGRRERAIELFADLKKSPQWEEMGAEGIATIYLALGDHDSAIEALEKAYDERSWLVTTLGTDAQYDPIRADPRFQDLLRRVGLLPD